MYRDTEAQRAKPPKPEPQPAPFANFRNGGYPRLAHFMGAHGNIAIFRKFGDLNTFTLLSLQADLVRLEMELQDDLQASDSSLNPDLQEFTRNFHALRNFEKKSDEKQNPENKSPSDDPSSTKNKIQVERKLAERINKTITEITNKLDQYNRMVMQFSQISSLRDARKADIKVLRKWLDGDCEGEGGHFLSSLERRTWEEEFTKDLLVLDSTDDDTDIFSKDLSPFIYSAVDKLGFNRFKEPIDHSGTVAYSGFKRTLRALSTTMAAILPAVSILALYYCDTMPLRIGVMIVITFGFAIILSVFTSAKRIEIFSATTAFAAVEVVFIGSATLNRN